MSTTDKKSRLLLVDDDEQVRRALSPALEQAGWAVTAVAGGQAALDFLTANDVDIVVLDLMMPEMNGLEVCARIREHSKVPVLMLTVSDTPADKVAALDIGADDYLTKPFAVDELFARLRALKRRSEYHMDDVVQVGDLSVDLKHRQVMRAGVELELRRREWDILALLAAEQGKVVSWSRLVGTVLGKNGPDALTEAMPLMRVHVSNLRQRVEHYPAVPRYVITEPGVGLRLAEDED